MVMENARTCSSCTLSLGPGGRSQQSSRHFEAAGSREVRYVRIILKGRSRPSIILKHEDFVSQVGFTKRGKFLKHEDCRLEKSAVDDAAPTAKLS